MLFKCGISLTISKNENKTGFVAKVLCGQQILAESMSTSFRYARKKALKQALAKLAEQVGKPWSDNPIYIQIEKQRHEALAKKKANDFAAKQKEYREKLEEKRQKKKKRIADEKEFLKQRDELRRKIKQESKLRKEKFEKLKAKKETSLQNISTKKRRHLEDKKK